MQPPDTPREETTYELHGDTYEDPYLWLEDDEDPLVAEWTDAQNEYTDEVLAETDLLDALRSRLSELADAVEYESIKPTDGGYFQRVRHPDQDHSVLTVRESLGDDRRELVDPNAWSEDGSVSMTWYEPSPDGDLVAYGVDEGGEENYDVHVMDVESEEDIEVMPEMGRAGGMTFSWKGDGFYFVSTGSPDEGGQLDKVLRYHRLGDDPDDDVIIEDDFPVHTWPGAVTAPDSEHVVVAYMVGWERAELYRLDHEAVVGGDVTLEPFLVDVDAMSMPQITGTDCYLRTSYGAPNYRVARLDLADPPTIESPDDLETVVSEADDAVMNHAPVTDDRIFVVRTRDVVSEISVYDRDGTHLEDVALPGTGAVSLPEEHRGADELYFTYEGFDQPPTICGFDGDFAMVDEPDIELARDFAVDQEWFESTDGATVPMFVVRRPDVERDARNPTLLYGYGGFDASMTPEFNRLFVPFVEDGGVLALANLRGGGEFGEEWHEAGRREHKQHTFDDVGAAADHLVARKWTTHDRLGIYGRSNGGLTVGAAITQFPEKFAAALCQVPLLDMLRFHTSLLGASWTSEYGDPDVEEEYGWIREYSPYQHVEEREYPDTFFVTAEGDTRVDPFHARKMAARMQERAEETLICLRVDTATGHGVGKPVSQAVAEQAEHLSFLYDRLGLDVDGSH